jgi:hypothetical protein
MEVQKLGKRETRMPAQQGGIKVILLAVLALIFTGGIVMACWIFNSLLVSNPNPVSETEPTPTVAISAPCDHIITLGVSKADGLANYEAVKPGDRVCLEAGTRSTLKLVNFQGVEGKPIVFVNSGGTVVIEGSSDDYAGIHIQASKHIRLTGAGVSERCGSLYPATEQQCGFRILGVSRGVAGKDRTGHIEIDHIEIQGPRKMGVTVKSGDEEGVNRSEWTQYDTYLHHNYIHEAGTEGFYVGSSFYDEGQDPVLEGVEVSYNLIIHTGWDGLQVGSAIKNCTIHHNRIIQASQGNEPSQRSGIMNNSGSVCHIYNNFIIDSVSSGIYIQGNGGNQVYNNVIVRSGQRAGANGDGIVVIRGSNKGQDVFIWNNTIIEPGRYGIRFRNDQGNNNLIQNNLIVSPGYRSGDGDNAYINTDGLTNIIISNNLLEETVAEVGFTNPEMDDYSLLPNSIAIDAGVDLMEEGVVADHIGIARPQGLRPDIGAFEYMTPLR